jgi:hypothetical protein
MLTPAVRHYLGNLDFDPESTLECKEARMIQAEFGMVISILNEDKPDWFNVLDTCEEHFNLFDPSRCVLGQLYPFSLKTYSGGYTEAYINLFGFAPSVTCPSKHDAMIHKAWRDIVALMREEATIAATE